MSTSPPPPAPDETPSPARMYDYYLGGYHNFPADRAAAERVIELYPEVPLVAQANRAFLRRAVNFLVAQGVTQFLDLGSGIPTAGNVHDVAQQAHPDARVVYVDIDPVAVLHSSALLEGNPRATVIQADARQPATILGHPEVRRVLDFTRPVAALLVSFLPFVTVDAEATGLVRGLRDALASGSYLALTHATHETAIAEPSTLERITGVYVKTTNTITTRSRAQIADFFAGFDLVEPGLVYTPLWRPESDEDLYLDRPERAAMFAGVGRKP